MSEYIKYLYAKDFQIKKEQRARRIEIVDNLSSEEYNSYVDSHSKAICRFIEIILDEKQEENNNNL